MNTFINVNFPISSPIVITNEYSLINSNEMLVWAYLRYPQLLQLKSMAYQIYTLHTPIDLFTITEFYNNTLIETYYDCIILGIGNLDNRLYNPNKYSIYYQIDQYDLNSKQDVRTEFLISFSYAS